MINLSLNELKLIAKNKHCKDYENKSEGDLIKILSKPKPKINLSKKKIKEIKNFFSELRINEFRKSLYNIKNLKKNLSTPEIKESEKIFLNWKKVFLGFRSIMIMMTPNTEE